MRAFLLLSFFLPVEGLSFGWLSKKFSITSRGFDEKYGAINNSSIPTGNELAEMMGLKPFARAPTKVWKFAWRLHGNLLPILHWRDNAQPQDAHQSLKVIWNKAIAGLDSKSPAFDNQWTYDLLPGCSRWLLKLIPTRIFPRLHHATIEIRTVYLNKAIEKELCSLSPKTKVRLVALGSGYDTRYTRLLADEIVDEAWELDMHHVIEAKQKMLHRIQQRRGRVTLPHFRAVDFNDVKSFEATLNLIAGKDSSDWHTVFVSEGVLIYLDEGVPLRILETCRRIIPASSFCFADLICEVQAGNRSQAEEILRDTGWTLTDWLPKPGLARHMGVCN